MQSFNYDEWLELAAKRRVRAISKGLSSKKAKQKYIDDCRYIAALDTIINGWCDHKGLTVKFNRKSGGIYYSDSKEILVSQNSSPKYQVMILLHECGHHLIGKKQKYERYGMGYAVSNAGMMKTLHHRIDIVDEEFEAWHQGWKLSLRIGALAKCDKLTYDKTRVIMMKSYLEWALRK